MNPGRAFILLRSGRKLDLLNPEPMAWTDDDLATGLSRTYRWGGHSRCPLPLSVAQHSLLVLAIHEDASGSPLSYPQKLRELLHDAEEALLGGFDPVTPLRPHLGPGFAALTARLTAAVACRYQLPAWTPEEHARHKHADRLAAASAPAAVIPSRAALCPTRTCSPRRTMARSRLRAWWWTGNVTRTARGTSMRCSRCSPPTTRRKASCCAWQATPAVSR